MLKNPEVLRDIGVHVRSTGSPIYCRNHHLEPLGSRVKLPAVSRGALRKKSQAMNNAKQTLRNRIRAKRQALPPSHQHRASRAILKRLSKHPLFINSQNIAFYLANDGEIDPSFIIKQAWNMGKQVFLPILSPLNEQLYFAPYKPDSEMKINRFGINEPVCQARQWLRAHQLDVLFLPLVAFDKKGNRLGMGGGFYDRSLAYLSSRKVFKKPQLIGLAHELQQLDNIHHEKWDIPINQIITEKLIIKI
jgi:5-formyltetrahydrofolate cyclo-ligase